MIHSRRRISKFASLRYCASPQYRKEAKIFALFWFGSLVSGLIIASIWYWLYGAKKGW